MQLFLYIGSAPISHKTQRYSSSAPEPVPGSTTSPPYPKKPGKNKRLLLAECVKNTGKAVVDIEWSNIIHVGGYHAAVDRARHRIGLFVEICCILSDDIAVKIDRCDAADIALVADLVAVQIKSISARLKRQIPSEQCCSQQIQ